MFGLLDEVTLHVSNGKNIPLNILEIKTLCRASTVIELSYGEVGG